jgi:predicted nucleotidyltransferase
MSWPRCSRSPPSSVSGPLQTPRSTLDAADAAQLERVVALVREVLGDEIVGAYLFGSAVLGGLRHESDLDVLAVVKRPTTLEQKQRLVQPLLLLSARDGHRHLELTVVVGSEIRPWRYPPHMDFQYGDWLRSDFAEGKVEPSSTENPDLALLLAAVRLYGEPVLGPPAPDVIDVIPPEDVRTAITGEIESLAADLGSDTRNVLLTFARMWTTVLTGEIRPKDEAASWALARLPSEHRPVLELARGGYLGEGEDDWAGRDDEATAAADYMIREIRALA